MALHPVGPLPASTYWRRRLVLAVGLLVLLLLARSCVGGSGRPASHVTAAATPVATAAAGPSPTAAAAPTPAPATPSASPAPAAVGNCPDSVLRVVAKTDVADYPAGSSPRLTVTVTNASGTDCRRDLGSVALLVYSGTDRIWSSADCSGPAQREVLTLKAGASLEKTVTWYGKRSARGCPSPAQQPKALPGTYWAVAEVGGLRSAQAVFRIH